MTVEEMILRKRELGYTNKTIAEKSGVPFGTVQKIFSGATKAPREETLRAIEAVLAKPTYAELIAKYNEGPPSMVREYMHHAFGPTKEKKLYTADDYNALPDEKRVELIDGVFYEMHSPKIIHQAAAGFLYKKLLDHVLETKGPCRPFISPVDVYLDADDKTIVQPDVLVLCNTSMINEVGRVIGAPDLIIEVLSKSTRKKDMTLKHHKYANAGVREYWLVDTDKQSIVVYDLEHDALPRIYGPVETLPVLIWEGRYSIDLKEFWEHIRFMTS